MTQKSRTLMIIIPLALLLPVVAGCFGGAASDLPELAEVTGKVTFDGKPLEGASVLFTPTTGRASYASTDQGGLFSLRFNANAKGAMLGKHSVQISKYANPEDPGNDLLPSKYNLETTLTADVTKDGPNEFTFELKSK